MPLYIDVYLRDRHTKVAGIYHDDYDYESTIKDDDYIKEGYESKRDYAIHSIIFQYEENNWSCDHNRSLNLYRDALHIEFNTKEFDCGTNRIIVDKIIDRETKEIIYQESDNPDSEDYIGEINLKVPEKEI
jgi:hypothetical protein